MTEADAETGTGTGTGTGTASPVEPMDVMEAEVTEESRSVTPPMQAATTASEGPSPQPSPQPSPSITRMSPPLSAREVLSVERDREREPQEGMSFMSGPKADKACARCKRHHKGCDKSLPVCSSCLKMFGEVGAAKRMCNYNYVVHPGRRIEEFTSERQTTDDSATAAANARRKMELRRAEVDRLRKIVLHLCDRDLDIIPNIGKNDYSFLDPDPSKEYRVSAPEEFKTLFKSDMWDWPQSTMDIVPLLIKDGVVSIVKPGEEKPPPAEFNRQHYEKRAEEGKDGWEEQFGEKPSIEHWQHLVRRLENRNEGLKYPLKRRRVIDESDDSMDDVSGEVDMNPDSNSFNPINGPSSHPRIRLRLTNSGAAVDHNQEPSKRRATVGGETAELVGRYEPKASMPAFRAVRVAAQSAPNPSPRLRAQAANSVGGGGGGGSGGGVGGPPSTPRNLAGSHLGGYGTGELGIRDVLDNMERDMVEISSHAQTSNDDLVKAASRDACDDLRRKMEELRKVERDLMNSAMSPSAKSVLLKSILKRLEN